MSFRRLCFIWYFFKLWENPFKITYVKVEYPQEQARTTHLVKFLNLDFWPSREIDISEIGLHLPALPKSIRKIRFFSGQVKFYHLYINTSIVRFCF